MINIRQLFIYLFISLTCVGCFLKKNDSDMELINEDELINLSDSTLTFDSTFVDSNIVEPFYPQEKKINELIEDIEALKAQVRDYDSRIRNWDSSVDIFRKIQYRKYKKNSFSQLGEDLIINFVFNFKLIRSI